MLQMRSHNIENVIAAGISPTDLFKEIVAILVLSTCSMIRSLLVGKFVRYSHENDFHSHEWQV